VPFKDKNKKRRYERKYRLKRIAILERYKQMKGCAHCGNKDFRCLIFHAPDGHEDVCIGELVDSWKRLKAELKHCIVLCANCHKIVHWKIYYEN